MAFDYTNLYPDTSGNGGYTKSWNYTTVTDSIATCSAAGYFNKVATRLGIGDNIVVAQVDAFDKARTALVDKATLFVTGISNGVVTTNVFKNGLENVPNVDATNASNISAGTLAAARLANFQQNGTGAVARTYSSKLQDALNVLDFGAKGDTFVLFDGAISSGSTAFSSASASFVNQDVGKLIRIVGAGAAGVVLETTIAARVSPTAVTTTAAASTTVTGAQVFYGSDDTTAIQNAVNSILIRNNPARILLPGLIFMTTAPITVPQFTSLSLQGKGVSSVSNLGSIIMPSIASDGIVINTADAAYLDNFGVTYAGAANANTAAIRFSPPAGQFNYYSRVRNLTINNAYDGIVANEVVHSVFEGNLFVNFSHTGVTRTSVLGSPVGDSGDNKFSHNFFQITSGSPLACFYWTGGGGDSFVNNKCMLAQFGVYLNPATNVNTSQLNISNNSFDGVTTAGVRFVRQDGTSALSQLVINSNTFNLFQPVAAQAVNIPTDANGTALSVVTISGNAIVTPTGAATNAFGLNSISGLYIGGNTIVSNNAGTNGIGINPAVANSVLGPNTFIGTFAVEWFNTSTSVRVALAETAPPTLSGTSGSVGVLGNSHIINPSGTFTLGLPNAAQSTGRLIRMKSVAGFAVNSSLSNVVPLAGGAAGTALFPATAGKWAVLQSDGTNWITMAGN